MRRTNTQIIQNILDDGHKKSTSYFMGATKSKDEKLADIRRDKKEGDVWEEFGTEMTKHRGGYMSTKSKILQEIRDENKMPLVCPECGKVMKKYYDKKPWNMEGKCSDCMIEEEGKMRIKGTWKAHVEKKLRANALSQIRDNKKMLEEQLENLSKSFQVVGNETGELETWSVSQTTVENKRKILEGNIAQLNIIEKKLNDEEKESENNE